MMPAQASEDTGDILACLLNGFRLSGYGQVADEALAALVCHEEIGGAHSSAVPVRSGNGDVPFADFRPAGDTPVMFAYLTLQFFVGQVDRTDTGKAPAGHFEIKVMQLPIIRLRFKETIAVFTDV